MPKKSKNIEDYDKKVKNKLKKFKLKPADAHNLYDLFYMADTSGNEN